MLTYYYYYYLLLLYKHNSNNNILLLLPSSRIRGGVGAAGVWARVSTVPVACLVFPASALRHETPPGGVTWRVHTYFILGVHIMHRHRRTHSRTNTHTHTRAPIQPNTRSQLFLYTQTFIFSYIICRRTGGNPREVLYRFSRLRKNRRRGPKTVVRGTPLLYRLVHTTLGSLGPYDRQRNCVSRNS